MWIRIKSRVTTPLFSFACDVVTGRSHTEKLPISNTTCYTAVYGVCVCFLVEFTSSFYYLNSTFTKYFVDKSHCERRIRWIKIFEFFFFFASPFTGCLFWMVYFLWSDCCHFLVHTSYGQLQKKNVTKRIEYNECFETPNTKKTGWEEGKKRMPSSFNRNLKKKKKNSLKVNSRKKRVHQHSVSSLVQTANVLATMDALATQWFWLCIVQSSTRLNGLELEWIF